MFESKTGETAPPARFAKSRLSRQAQGHLVYGPLVDIGIPVDLYYVYIITDSRFKTVSDQDGFLFEILAYAGLLMLAFPLQYMLLDPNAV